MQIEIIDKLFLPMLFFIGIVTSWEDFCFSKIRNKWIILGTIFSIAVLAGFAVCNLVVGSFYIIPWDYFSKVILNSFLALLIGFLLWRYGMLAAGDAKLFFVFSLLLPLKYYWKSYLPYFPSFVLLMNIFFPVLFFIFLKASWYAFKSLIKFFKSKPTFKMDQLINLLIKDKDIGGLIKISLGFIAIFLFVEKLRGLVAPWIVLYLPNEGFLFLLLFIAYRPLFTYLRKSKVVLILALLFLVVYLGQGMIYTPQEIIIELSRTIKMVFIFLVGLQLLRKLFNYYTKNATLKKIKINELEVGMSLVIDDEKDKDKKPELGTVFGGGFNQSQVDLAKKWAKQNNIKEIEIYERFPFAYWMFLGVIITIILKGSLVTSIF
ncbi:hypothetical protein KKH35_02210 [Patescibacteria group bacterium]|nr:hypothetical protein [Patescibacteria group bacterium]